MIMENNSKSNLEYQYKTIIESVFNEIEFANECSLEQEDLDCDGLIEKLKGIKEIQIAFSTLTN